MLVKLIKKENDIIATVSTQNNVTGQKVDLSDSLHLQKVSHQNSLPANVLIQFNST